MPTRRFYANAATQQTLSAGITNSATSLTIQSSFAGWPTSYPFFATISNGSASMEIVSVTAVVGLTATIVRGQDGTAAISHLAGETLDMTVVRQDMDEANAHTSANSAVHGLTGIVVGTSDTQTLTNKTLTSPVLTTASLSSPTITGTTTAAPLSVTGGVTAGGAVTAASASITGLTATGSITVNSVAGSIVPTGGVIMFGGAAGVIPSGWLLCDGSAISRTGANAALFSVIGTAYGAGNGTSTFNLPNMSIGNFPYGSFNGDSGGGTPHTHGLTSAQAEITLAGNTVFINRVTSPSWTANVSASATTATSSSGEVNGAALIGTTDSTPTIPPYVGFNFIIKL